MLYPTYDKDLVSQSSHNLNSVLQTNRKMTENSLKMRAMAYLAQAKAKILTETIFEVEDGKKVVKKEKKAIEQRNKELSTQVEYEKRLNEEKEKLLWEQSKQAQMGEMLSMIAHQWKQPLTAISNYAGSLSVKNQLDRLDKEGIEKYSRLIQDQTQSMFGIVNDFMEFGKTESNKEFYLYHAVDKLHMIIDPLLANSSILLEIKVDPSLKIFHNKKTLEHVLLNLVVNSRDAFDGTQEIVDKTVKIYTTIDKDAIQLHVEDNAGGIPEDIIDKIFDPYFTTKGKGKGTGIGLWMSKKMIENIPETTISVKVNNGCTLFTVRFDPFMIPTGVTKE